MLSRWFQKISEPVVHAGLEKMGWSGTSETITSLIAKLPHLSTVAITTGMTSITAGMIYANQREHAVIAKKFENDCHGTVRNASEFIERGVLNHGSLPASVVEDIKTKKEYVKKGAHSDDRAMREFMIGNFLHAVSKHQPKYLILQEDNKNGTAQFYTLSSKHQNTQDLENFIRAGRIKEFKTKKVTKLEESLASIQVVGKQVDNTLSNLIIQETPNKFKISSIDHESAYKPGFGFLNSGQMRFPTHPSALVNSIRDLSEPSEDNKAGLAGDARAKEFGYIAANMMSQKKVIDYYERVANANLKPLIENCYELAAHSTLFKAKDCARYDKHFQKIQELAAKQVAQKK